MEHTLRYCSSRTDVWRWYWKAWKAKLWRTHVLVAALTAGLLFGARFETTNLASLGLWFVVSQLAVTAMFAAIPQIMFKASERVLVVSPQGWSTKIGKQSGSRTWAEVASIAEEDGQVIITGKNGNTLIIPPGAFADSEFRLRFLQDIQQWKTAYAG
jgi:hypothetical protein